MKNKEEKIINGEVYVYCEEYDELIPKYSHNDKNGLDYELDTETFTYLPMLKQPEYEDYNIGIYGKEREKFLKENYAGYYMQISGSFKLQPHLIETDKAAYEMEDKLTAEYAKSEGVDEKLKKADMFEWVGRMKNIQNRVREVVFNELIYIEPYGSENK